MGIEQLTKVALAMGITKSGNKIRPPLSKEEKAKRREKNKLAKKARKRNRK